MRTQRRRASAGFTLIELLVTVTVLAVLLRLAVPSFATAILTNRLSSYTNTFVGSVQFARSEAIKRNYPVTLCASSDGQTCASSGTWAQGWIVSCPGSTTPGMCGSGGSTPLVLQHQPAIGSGYHFTSSSDSYTMVFPASGVGVNQLTMTVCRATPQPGSQERQITVAATGRTAVVTTHTGTCP